MAGNLIRRLAHDLWELLFGGPSPGRIKFRLGAFVTCYSTKKTPEFHHYPLRGEATMAFDLPADKFTVVSIELKDKKGNPAAVDGVPAWATDNTEVLALEPAADGMSCKVTAVGTLTATPVVVQVTCDADLGEGTKPVIGTLEVNVVAGEALQVSLTPGPLQDQP